MKFSVNSFSVYALNNIEKYACELFSEELRLRTGSMPLPAVTKAAASLCFEISDDINNKDTFIIKENTHGLTVYAKTIRGLIFGYSLFLRKAVFDSESITLVESIEGTHSPHKQIRGHQISYRTTPNTYDAWTYEQYFRCQLDMMAFGANTIEHNGSSSGGEFRNRLMKYDQEEFLIEASHLADKVDMDVSLWHANCDSETEEEALASRDRLYSLMPRLDYCFVPGGDPGNMQADDFMNRCKLISRIYKKYHPQGEMHISAQAPHCFRDWGEIFVKELSAQPDEIDAVIMGPNHAYPMHTLRERIPSKYPLRFYPDITHNLRCEYPVNFQHDDWHFAFCNTLSRESVNPRPTELRTLNRIFSPYTIGGVSYSEGAHDDVNKAVWSALEWNKDADLREILLDYARFFIYGVDAEEIADIILLLEKNWQGDPVENPCIDTSYSKLCNLLDKYSFLNDNWRFLLLYFRGCCDMLVKLRRAFENKLCKEALKHLKNGDINSAIAVLRTPYTGSYNELRDELNTLAEKLFNLIGIQLDVENYCTDSWERGATLDTIDNNVSDRAFLLSKLNIISALPQKERKSAIDMLLSRTTTDSDEIYYSVALHGLNTLGLCQNGEFYMDVQGDRPYTKENPLPMSMTKVYDHFSFNARFGGFRKDTDYVLTVVYKDKTDTAITEHTVTANGNVIYKGSQFGGTSSFEKDEILLAKGFKAATYTLPAAVFNNGALELCISEPTQGVNICELWIKKA